MSYYIIIRGPLGIGKSTIAKRLTKILHAEYVSIDSILEKNKLDKIDKRLGFIPVKNFIGTNKIVLQKVKSFLKNNRIVVFDGNFYHKEQLKHLINNLSEYNCFVFTLKAPLEICVDRDSKRKIAYGKDAAITVHRLVSGFDYGIIINTDNRTINQTIKEIRLHLPKN